MFLQVRGRQDRLFGGQRTNFFWFIELFLIMRVLTITAAMAPTPGVAQGKHPDSDSFAMQVVPDLSGSFFRRLYAGVFLSASQRCQRCHKGGLGLGPCQRVDQLALGVHDQGCWQNPGTGYPQGCSRIWHQ